MMDPVPKKSPYVVPSTARRDLFVGLGLGIVVLAFIIFGVMSMGNRVVGNTLTGTITAKNFTPAPEEQVTIGKSGVHSRHLDGEYVLEVTVKGKVYTVWVDKEVYAAKKVGEEFVFLRPKDE